MPLPSEALGCFAISMCAGQWQSKGSKGDTCSAQAMPDLMPGFDKEIAKMAQRLLINPRPIDWHTNVLATKVTPGTSDTASRPFSTPVDACMHDMPRTPMMIKLLLFLPEAAHEVATEAEPFGLKSSIRSIGTRAFC